MLDGIIERLIANDTEVWDTIATMDNEIIKLRSVIEQHRGNTKRAKAITRLTISRLRAATNSDLLWKIIRSICVKLYAQNVDRLSEADVMLRNTMVDSIAMCYNILLTEVYDVAPISEWGNVMTVLKLPLVAGAPVLMKHKMRIRVYGDYVFNGVAPKIAEDLVIGWYSVQPRNIEQSPEFHRTAMYREVHALSTSYIAFSTQNVPNFWNSSMKRWNIFLHDYN